jgi:Ca-activated chloride channel family protein
VKVKSIKRSFPVIFLAVAVVFSTGWSWKDLFRNKADKAFKLYTEGKYKEALDLYSEEAIENPDSPEISYNMGNMLYRNERYDDALPSYSGMSSGDKDKLKEALETYKEAIKMAPDDLDAKYNYEFVKNLLSSPPDSSSRNGDQQKQDQQQQDQQKQEQQQQNQQEQKDQGKDQEQQKNNDAGKDDEQKGENQNRQEKPGEEESKDQQEQKGQKEQKQMNKEDADRMLEALMKKEKEQLGERFKTMGEGKVDVEKDW